MRTSGKRGARSLIPRAAASWLVIALTESVLGTLRELVIKPYVGEALARWAGFAAGCAVVVCVAWRTAPWVGASGTAQLSAVGIVWAALMLGFEIGVGVARGYTLQRIAAEFDPFQGGAMCFGMLLLLLAPSLGALLHHSKCARD